MPIFLSRGRLPESSPWPFQPKYTPTSTVTHCICVLCFCPSSLGVQTEPGLLTRSPEGHDAVNSLAWNPATCILLAAFIVPRPSGLSSPDRPSGPRGRNHWLSWPFTEVCRPRLAKPPVCFSSGSLQSSFPCRDDSDHSQC